MFLSRQAPRLRNAKVGRGRGGVGLLGVRFGIDAYFLQLAFTEQILGPSISQTRLLLHKKQNLRPSIEPRVVVEDVEPLGMRSVRPPKMSTPARLGRDRA